MALPILIVEDDPDGQEMVAHIMRHLGVAHDVVGDAEKAIHKLMAGEHFQAVIIDLALPGKDGWELLSEIRENPETQDLTCIAITAYHTSKTREEALHSGFNAYFSKPLDATHFARELAAIL
ncbi:response regulator [Phototrophicus methaneseepsis]|uniref:Response regulator n=1 Tax=Phototrophicus methaneseepsis TaxID=2710758 RepID=A0A7S8EAA3_9CHLR|nr:response regulator [Phototrophicus methaneseepsis]QPC83287.1 response regulator [Phototrophicus methaneseepsis]